MNDQTLKISSTLVVIPTYNEKDNISQIVPLILAGRPHFHVLVVDDSSPDGTSETVKGLKEFGKRVFLLLRTKKEGLGRAYLAGFEWALKNNYSWICEMDADFSHRPEDLILLDSKKANADFLIGSRYTKGGEIPEWNLMRRIISKGGSLYSRIILNFPVGDWTGGFNLWSAKVLNGIELDTIKSNGYSFQIELKFRALKNGFKVLEVPIRFEERREGQSKMSFKIVIEAFYRVWQIRFGYRKRS